MTFVDLALARRLELAHAHRTVEYALAQARLDHRVGASFIPADSGQAVYAGPGSPVNGARAMGLSGRVDAATLERVEAFFLRHEAQSRVTVCPLADPSLRELLAARAYALQGFFSILMAETTLSPTRPAHATIEVREVGPADEWRWLQTVGTGFAEGGAADPIIPLIRPTFHSSSARSFLAWLDGEPAGGGTVIFHEGVAEFCSASTVPWARGRGVQTALIHARLAAARHAGCDLALVITASAAPSQRNVERLGFQLAYTRPVMTSRRPRQESP
jgi:hypothetical protein